MRTGTLLLLRVDEPPPQVGWLVPLDGSQLGHTLRLGNGVTVVGAGATAHIRIEAPEVQKEHCRIILAPTGFVLHDGGSKLGTLVDGRPVHDELELVDGQVIAIGGIQLAFKCIGDRPTNSEADART
jgi:pSer/pThr/pTyr-binding forkhead associated (FHA) protein